MLIKHKLIANTAILVVAMLVMLGLLSYAVSSLDGDIHIARTIGNVEADVLQLRRNEKDFLARKDLKYFDKFSKNMSGLKADIYSLDEDLNSIGLNVAEVSSLAKVVGDYDKHFKELVESQKRIGLNSKAGLCFLEGNYRRPGVVRLNPVHAPVPQK